MSDKRIQGSMKTPGGKLVNVDFDVDDNRLRNVAVHGDFFLDPDSALAAIRGALEGLPVDATETVIAAAVSRALPPGTEWLGSSPEAVAAAVRRAVASASDGKSGGGERGFG